MVSVIAFETCLNDDFTGTRQPRMRLTVSKKVFLLVAIPLFCEICFVAVLLILVGQAEAQAAKDKHARELASAVNTLLVDIVEANAAMKGSSIGGLIKSGRIISQYQKRGMADISKLRLLVKDDPQAIAVIEQTERGMRDGIAAITYFVENFEGADSANFEDLKKESTKKIELAAKRMVTPELAELARKTAQNAESGEQEILRSRIKNALIALLAVNVGVSLALAFYASRQISARIQLIGENARRFADDRPLLPITRGSDEIAEVDQVFHHMAAAISEFSRKQGAIFDNAADIICILDRELRITKINPAVEMYEFVIPALIGSHISTLIPAREMEAFKHQLTLARRELSTKNVPISIQDPENRLHSFDCSVHWSEAENSFFCVFHDMTAIRQAEKLKADVVAMVTHDLRSPLSSIMHFQEMLTDGAFGNLNERGSRLLKTALLASQTMKTLINDLVDMERIASGRLKLDKQKIYISEIVDEAIATMQLAASEAQISIKLHPAEGRVEADPDRIKQVVANLLSNAIKFSPEKNQIDVIIIRENGNIKVSVVDRGPGIPISEQGAIFERFYQVKGEKSHLGSGLGLSICKALVGLHKGTILLESEPGKGSVFSFTLPLLE